MGLGFFEELPLWLEWSEGKEEGGERVLWESAKIL